MWVSVPTSPGGHTGIPLPPRTIGPDGTPDSVAQEFEWRVSNSSYATIRDNGDGTATITGRKAGNVKIGAIAKDGSGVREVYARLGDAGMQDLTCQIYEGGRHEMHNETNRAELFADELAWLDSRLFGGQGRPQDRPEE